MFKALYFSMLCAYTDSTNTTLPVVNGLSVEDHTMILNGLTKGIQQNYIEPQYELEMIKRLKSIVSIDDKCNPTQLNELKTISQHFQLNNLYYLQLPEILKLINKKPNWQSKDILRALNLNPLALCPQNVSYELSLLMKSSIAFIYLFNHRSLYLSDLGIGSNETIIPWIFRLGEQIGETWTIFFAYCYQVMFDYYYKQLSLPKLDEIYFDDVSKLKERSNLLILINKYHFIPWHRQTIQNIKHEFIDKSLAFEPSEMFWTTFSRYISIIGDLRQYRFCFDGDNMDKSMDIYAKMLTELFVDLIHKSQSFTISNKMDLYKMIKKCVIKGNFKYFLIYITEIDNLESEEFDNLLFLLLNETSNDNYFVENENTERRFDKVIIDKI
eukprot:428536_1